MCLARGLLDSSAYIRPFQSLFSSTCLFSESCVSHPSQLSIPCPDCCLLPQNAVASTCAFKCFGQRYPGSGLNPGFTPCQTKQRQTTVPVLEGAGRAEETLNHNSWRIKSILLLLVPGELPSHPQGFYRPGV